LFLQAGRACEEFHNSKVVDIVSKKVQCDEIWSFVYAKEKNKPEDKEGGSVWTWVGIDSDTKLVISWFVGKRDEYSATEFMQDLASRIKNKVQLTTDGLKAYLEAVEDAFHGNADYGQLVKMYKEGNNRYTGAIKTPVTGQPDMKYISTSHIERQNLTMRMGMRRFTRKTNGFSKKIENHCYAIALHFVYYNFCRIHQTLRVTPAMEAGLTKDIMELEDIVKLIHL
jgi:IS1 family transposase